ncbi:hypothetical protein KJ853_03465 [Patescibacteria group bacterium]|nr:hypothetical protein [Patescibacteria group bacterium]
MNQKGISIIIIILIIIGLLAAGGVFYYFLKGSNIFSEKKSDKSSKISCIYKKGEYEMRAYDSEGRATGLFDGKVRQEIPRSVYDNGNITIFNQADPNSYTYEIFCKKDGNYQFAKSSVVNSKETIFNAVNIPISAGQAHRYKFDWNALARGEKGATLMVDADGDSKFEKTITSDTELICEEFLD